jgi:hypothetical protein
MTVAAREVLEDCRAAAAEIGNCVQGRAWRCRWVAAVVLLRTVGYVLATVDSKRNSKLKQAIDSAWARTQASKPEPSMFWQFIDEERNNIIHEYEVGAGQGATVYPGTQARVEHHYVINTGIFAGRDQREVLGEAIAWWAQYLDAIDCQAK